MFCTMGAFARIPHETLHSVREFLDSQDPESAGNRLTVAQSEKRPLKTPITEPNSVEISEDESADEDREEGFPLSWEPDSSENENKADLTTMEAKWLRNCLLAASPSGELLTAASVQRLTILGANIQRDGSTRMELAAKVQIDVNAYPGEAEMVYITSLHILPLGSHRLSDAGGIDWTCIVVGLSTGSVEFFTDRGVLVFRERCAHGPIRALRFGRSVFSATSRQGELSALAGSWLFVVDGATLYAALRKSRAEVAKGDRSLTDICNDLPLLALCVELGTLRHVVEAQPMVARRPGTFEQYSSAAHADGPLARVERAALPMYAEVFAATRASFGAFLWFDTEAQPFNPLSQAFFQLTSKVASAVPSFGFRSLLGIGTSRKDRPPAKECVVDAKHSVAEVRSRLTDPRRRFERSTTAPAGWSLVAVCDDSARVLLVDSRQRTVIRVWKGYRNARCAFVESAEGTDDGSRQRKRALFLVIFAPKRGLLEVWSMQHGPRVAAFNVDPHGRLIAAASARDSLLHAPLDSDQPLPDSSAHPNAFFISSSGQIAQIAIPFHLAARDADAARLHDENLLKEFHMEAFVDPNGRPLHQKLKSVFKTLRGTDAQRRLVEKIVRVAGEELVGEILDEFLESADGATAAHLQSMRRLVAAHETLRRIARRCSPQSPASKEPSPMDVDRLSPDLHSPALKRTKSDADENQIEEEPKRIEENAELQELLSLSEGELEEMNLPLLISACNRPQMTPAQISLQKFVGLFQLGAAPTFRISLRESIDPNELGNVVFSVLLLKGSGEDFCRAILDGFGFTVRDLAQMLVRVWLSQWNGQPWRLAPRAVQLFAELFAGASHDDTITVLESLEAAVTQSENPTAALFLGLCVQAATRRDSHSATTSRDDDEWESLDDAMAWTVLQRRHLTAMALIQSLMWSRTETENVGGVGLARLLEKGYGFYREQIGLYVANTQMSVDELMTAFDKSQPLADLSSRLLRSIHRLFPHSFAAPLLVADAAWESASLWHRERRGDTARLRAALDYANAIGDRFGERRVQHGVAVMLWDTFLRAPLQNLYNFVRENEGRMPKESQLRKESFIREIELPEFITIIRRLLQIIQLAVVDLELQPPCEHDYEDFIENFFTNRRLTVKKSRRHCLTEVAANQAPVNYHLVLHHIHLCMILELELRVGIRRPLDRIFDDAAQRAFFAGFREHPLIPMDMVDDRLLEERQNFMEEVVEAVGVEGEADAQYHDRWELIHELVKDWRLDADALRVKEVKMLHECDCDQEAERLYAAVQNRFNLAANLVPLVIGRFKAFVEADPHLQKKAERKLKSTTWAIIADHPDAFTPNFTPNFAQTLSFTNSVLGMFISHAANPSTEYGKQLQIQKEKRILTELKEFLEFVKHQ